MKNLGFSLINPTSVKENLIKLIASDWMLVTAGDKEKFNTMTANWGGVGYLWNKNVVFVFVRPERYTYEFMERKVISEGIDLSVNTLISQTGDMFTLSFFDEKYREALNICGSKSGRDCDKVAEAGLKPCFTNFGNPTFKEARLVIECRKLYAEMLFEDAFIDRGIFNTHYFKKGGLHKMYIAEIVNVWEK